MIKGEGAHDYKGFSCTYVRNEKYKKNYINLFKNKMFFYLYRNYVFVFVPAIAVFLIIFFNQFYFLVSHTTQQRLLTVLLFENNYNVLRLIDLFLILVFNFSNTIF